MPVTLQRNQKYSAKVKLGLAEMFASNDILKEKFEAEGLANVTVSGKGKERTVESTWANADQEITLPYKVSKKHDVTLIELKKI